MTGGWGRAGGPGRRRTALLLVIALLLAGGLALVWQRVDQQRCGAGVATVGDPSDPLLTPALMRQRPDGHRDRLAAALRRMGPPFGEVLAGVDYYYEQWLHLYGVQGGVLAWTKRNAPVTFLSGDDLAPQWAIRPTSKRVAWDASADRFVLLELSGREPVEVSSFDLTTGARQWCTRLPVLNIEGDPIGTTVLGDGSLVLAAQHDGRTTLARISGDGEQEWAASVHGVDRADFVGPFGDLVVVGGREEFHLRDGRFPVPHGDTVTAFHADSGRPAWRLGEGSSVHVVGVAEDRLVLLESGAGGALLRAVDPGGRPAWSTPLPGPAGAPPQSTLQSTLRGGVVLVRTPARLAAYSAASGHGLWSRPLPPTFTPYGFTLGMMPSLDATHVLVPTTSQLRILDVRTGRHRAYALPTDGISSTYWPYQLVATDQVIGVVTNTGAIVVRRD